MSKPLNSLKPILETGLRVCPHEPSPDSAPVVEQDHFYRLDEIQSKLNDKSLSLVQLLDWMCKYNNYGNFELDTHIARGLICEKNENGMTLSCPKHPQVKTFIKVPCGSFLCSSNNKYVIRRATRNMQNYICDAKHRFVVFTQPSLFRRYFDWYTSQKVDNKRIEGGLSKLFGCVSRTLKEYFKRIGRIHGWDQTLHQIGSQSLDLKPHINVLISGMYFRAEDRKALRFMSHQIKTLRSKMEVYKERDQRAFRLAERRYHDLVGSVWSYGEYVNGTYMPPSSSKYKSGYEEVNEIYREELIKTYGIRLPHVVTRASSLQVEWDKKPDGIPGIEIFKGETVTSDIKRYLGRLSFSMHNVCGVDDKYIRYFMGKKGDKHFHVDKHVVFLEKLTKVLPARTITVHKFKHTYAQGGEESIPNHYSRPCLKRSFGFYSHSHPLYGLYPLVELKELSRAELNKKTKDELLDLNRCYVCLGRLVVVKIVINGRVYMSVGLDSTDLDERGIFGKNGGTPPPGSGVDEEVVPIWRS